MAHNSMLNVELSTKIVKWYKALPSEKTAAQHFLRCLVGGEGKVIKAFPKIYDHTWHNINYAILGIAIWDADDRKIIGKKICKGLEVTNDEFKEIQAAFYKCFNFRDAVLDRRQVKVYHPFQKIID